MRIKIYSWELILLFPEICSLLLLTLPTQITIRASSPVFVLLLVLLFKTSKGLIHWVSRFQGGWRISGDDAYKALGVVPGIYKQYIHASNHWTQKSKPTWCPVQSQSTFICPTFPPKPLGTHCCQCPCLIRDKKRNNSEECQRNPRTWYRAKRFSFFDTFQRS